MRRTFRTDDRKEQAELGRILKGLREAIGLSQRELGSQIGRTHTYIGKIERGEQLIDMAALIDVAKLLGANASDIVAEVEMNCSSADS